MFGELSPKLPTVSLLTRGGTSGQVLTANGEGSAPVYSGSPTLTSPILGTPASGTLTNCTGLPAGGQLARSFYAYQSSAGQVLTTGAQTKITLDGEKFDTNSEFDSSTNYRHTPTVAGKYCYSAAVYVQAVADNKYVALYIIKNGGSEGFQAIGDTNSSQTVIPFVCGVLSMNGTTDYVELYCTHIHGSNRTVLNNETTTFLSGFLVGT